MPSLYPGFSLSPRAGLSLSLSPPTPQSQRNPPPWKTHRAFCRTGFWLRISFGSTQAPQAQPRRESWKLVVYTNLPGCGDLGWSLWPPIHYAFVPGTSSAVAYFCGGVLLDPVQRYRVVHVCECECTEYTPVPNYVVYVVSRHEYRLGMAWLA